MNHLSSIDASFLHFETPETPMHVGSLMLLDIPAAYKGDYFEDFKAMIAKRMHLASVLTRKLAPMPFELAEPVWIEDGNIDLDHHVRSLMLRRPGSMDQLQRLVARLHSSLLDRSRPLWELYVIEGLESGQVALYTKAHHSGVDGKAGTELAKVLYDISPQVREVPPPRRKLGNRSAGGYQLGMAELLQAAVSNSAQQYRKLAGLMPTAAKALAAAAQVLASQRTGKDERALTIGMAPKTIFNDATTNQRSYSTLTLPFEDLKALGKRVGGTVNTIVMAMCSEALRRFLNERSLLSKEALIAGVPVSLRAEGDDSMNNQVSMVRVDLATDIEDMAERFKAIHNSSEAAKAVVREVKPVLGVDMPMTGAPWIMTSLASLYGRSNLARRLPPMANVLISNVPGPQAPLYVAGARMVSFYPVSIPYHGSALNITVQSYAGQLDLGITACRRILSQEESYELIDHLRAALRKIERLPSVEVASQAQSTKADERAAAAAAPAPLDGKKKTPAKTRTATGKPEKKRTPARQAAVARRVN
ncbi:WS/DGAT/MGAT family acyltransferase [Variovorax boronicumulans]|uniref:diacylglycerol O-acyltransferase n=1 Tax=Variovorax boronicumulans TaxID=436515 RepID=A0AAW8DVH3_9BURK|nr:wax ester/triacylglycerol synthase family O-acyltransferase [Variovorax boronicumulans]MDP9878026.1 WS/DGAT/MGAT family acyltransferase [Variovorax boronicumulans]MDP9923309.1 WS/DGAT/MGAT family acyltransferase [Variovorax boronicumulans]